MQTVVWIVWIPFSLMQGGSFWDEVAFFTPLYPFPSRTTDHAGNSATLFCLFTIASNAVTVVRHARRRSRGRISSCPFRTAACLVCVMHPLLITASHAHRACPNPLIATSPSSPTSRWETQLLIWHTTRHIKRERCRHITGMGYAMNAIVKLRQKNIQ